MGTGDGGRLGTAEGGAVAVGAARGSARGSAEGPAEAGGAADADSDGAALGSVDADPDGAVLGSADSPIPSASGTIPAYQYFNSESASSNPAVRPVAGSTSPPSAKARSSTTSNSA